MTILHIAFYLGFLTFLILVLVKFFKIAKTPVHLRWELYPVPYEIGKGKYGGSYLEEPNWWKKPRKKDMFSEVFYMLEEILFLEGVFVHNRSLWLGSFPFHFSLYLYIICTLFALVGLIFGAFSPDSTNNFIWFNGLLDTLLWVLSLLGVLGGLVLLYKRTFEKKLSVYSNSSHYFNLFLISSLFATLLIGLIGGNFNNSVLLSFYYSVFTFSNTLQLSPIGQIHFYLLSFFLFYFPFTHMTHFFTKYFTYHKVRWDDEPLFPKTKLYEKLQKQLNYPVKWSAPHIGADGNKTWLILGTTHPFSQEKKNG